MKNRFIYFLFVFIFSASLLSAQKELKLKLFTGGKTASISFFNQKGIDYISSKELAEILSGNFYYSDKKKKVELKFKNYTLKTTADNPFVVLTSRSDKSQNVFQLPVAALEFKDDVYIPVKYSLEYLNLALEKELVYDNEKKYLSLSSININTTADLQKFDSPKAPEKEITKIPETIKPVKETVNSRFDIYGLNIEEKSNGTLIRVKSQKGLPGYRSSIKDGTLFLFLNGVTVDPKISSSHKPAGLVKRIRSKKVAENVQLEFDLTDDYSTSEAFTEGETNDILITVHNKLFTQNEEVEENKNKWIFNTIVIDPGHGGRDAGAIGVTGVREKDVNLAIGLKLGNMIKEKLPEMNVVYTRDSDEFVELYKRGKIANENKGNLFISIHCNSVAQKPSSARGFEVYLLRPGRTDEAIEIAEMENSVIKYEDDQQKYKKLDDENLILVSMAHSAYLRFSEEFSDLLNQEFKNKGVIPSRGVKQAGFYVLVGASMPSVLIESGFLSNRMDEAYLKSTEGQREIAQIIFNAVKKYKERYDKEFEDEISFQ